VYFVPSFEGYNYEGFLNAFGIINAEKRRKKTTHK